MPIKTAGVVGMQFRPQSAREHFHRLKDGDPLTLNPEPTNKFDPNAVMVISGNHHIGYIPRDLAPTILGFIKESRVDKVIKRWGSRIEIHYRD